MEKYVNRLFEEWKQHDKIIVAADFDDTISPWRKDFNTEDVNRTIDLLKKSHETGAYIVIFTACNSDRYDDIRKYCQEKGINISKINENPLDLPYGKNGKIYANIFLDDRAGLSQSLDILETAMYKYRGYKQTKEKDYGF